ncbi:MAG: peptidoglycan DD-metalloendopeptidase family protein [Firmicutes bacterium]|nr:peptidoglycan DD-metalloendopeptidase family protein [Bacillota bacterium]
MSYVFLAVLNMSITATIVALAVIVARIPLKKAPKIFSYALWAVVLFRLVVPFNIESAFGLMPGATVSLPAETSSSLQPPPVNNNPLSQRQFSAPYGFQAETSDEFVVLPGCSTEVTFSSRLGTLSPAGTQTTTVMAQSVPVNAATAEPAVYISGMSNRLNISQALAAFFTGLSLIQIAAIAWVIGVAVTLLYGGVRYTKLKSCVRYATRISGNIFESDRIDAPFVLGFIRPKIYFPLAIDLVNQQHILKHEQTHIARRDYLVMLIAFCALSLHWFNPVIWVSYWLMSKDMEMSCDEAVLRQTGTDIRGEYSTSLLNLAIRQTNLFNPLGFGEGNVKARVLNVINFKRPKFVVVAFSLVLLAVFALGFGFDRVIAEPYCRTEAAYEISSDTSTVSSASVSVAEVQGNTEHGNYTPNFIWPVPGHMLVASGFGERELPILGPQTGIDIKVPEGSNVYAAAAGRVILVGSEWDTGKTIIIRHNNGYSTVYFNNSASFVYTGQWVSQGELISTVGRANTDLANHMHFDVRYNWFPVDPLKYFPSYFDIGME